MNWPDLHIGAPGRLGATLADGGVNFAVFSAHATAIELCLFDEGGTELRRFLPGRTGDIWHGFLRGAAVGQRYGFRAHGPWAPADGHLFNPAKFLIDPYARALDGRLIWHPSMTGHQGGPALAGGTPTTDDSAPFVPKALVVADREAEPADCRPATLVYEAHVKGLTLRHPGIAPAAAGCYQGLAGRAIIDHMKTLGVSHLELLPVAAFLDDRHVYERGLTNYWGYQPIAMMAPEPRYGGPGDLAAAIAALARDGIGVILDVVFNHTGEGDAEGPTICYRGLDNKSYYALGPNGENLNPTGTGNSLNLGHPMVLRLVIDALRHWAAMGVAGFRFDLAATLLRGNGGGFDPGSGFLSAVADDPVLSRLILIAEPWDIGPGGYRLGQFPAPFLEWNDRFRDGVRRFWRGDGRPAELAARLAGSAELFERPGRSARTSVNFLTSHDGFTLEDIVSYNGKHNGANGEMNHDGHHDNCSDNLGAEGATGDPAMLAARRRRKRAMLATLFLAQGTPMLLAGDEFGQSQRGNNNAYAQDNDTSWLNWPAAEPDLCRFVGGLAAIRRGHPAIGQGQFLHGTTRPEGGRDLIWHRADGAEPTPGDWQAGANWPLGCTLRPNAPAPGADETLFALFNTGPETEIVLPEGRWTRILDSATADFSPVGAEGRYSASAQSVQLFVRGAAAGQRE